MNARTPEEHPSRPSSAPPETHHETPSDHFLDALMEGPRVRAAYFSDQLALRFPAGGYDPQSAKREEVSVRAVTGQLKSYEHHWLRKYINSTLEEFRDFAPDTDQHKAAYNELTFHLINKHTMPHWYRAFALQEGSKLDARSLNAAQIHLALESASLQRFKLLNDNDPEDTGYVDPQLESLDAMIGYLQLMIDAEYEDIDPESVVTPAPMREKSLETPSFLLFTPDYAQRMELMRLPGAEAIPGEVTHTTPGRIAQIALARTKISTLSSWPEFSSRSSLHAFMTAHSSLPKTDADDPAIEKLRQKLGEVVRESLF